MPFLTNMLIVACGGALGATARYLVGVGLTRALGHGFPWGTLAVNLLGSIAMGGLVGYGALRTGLSEPMRLMLAAGFLGSFTTFSTFSLDVVALWERGAIGLAIGYLVVSLAGGIGGLLLALSMWRMTA